MHLPRLQGQAHAIRMSAIAEALTGKRVLIVTMNRENERMALAKIIPEALEILSNEHGIELRLLERKP